MQRARFEVRGKPKWQSCRFARLHARWCSTSLTVYERLWNHGGTGSHRAYMERAWEQAVVQTMVLPAATTLLTPSRYSAV